LGQIDGTRTKVTNVNVDWA